MPRTPEIPLWIMHNLKSISFVVFELKDAVNIIRDALIEAHMSMKSNAVIKRCNKTADDRHSIQIRPPEPCSSVTNISTEQIEPMDLSCVKIASSNVVKNTRYEVKHQNYLEPRNSDLPLPTLPLPPNINEATLLILKSVYDFRKQNEHDSEGNSSAIRNSILSQINKTTDGRHYIKLRPLGPCSSVTNNSKEQIEPMDLSCVKIASSNVVKHQNYLEPRNSDLPLPTLPLPPNINEATFLILKSVYGIYLLYKSSS
ncbi:hypothetical protein ACI65C_003302 [Semiaphis heraclei]